MEGQFIITKVAPDAKPIAPKAVVKKYIRQCGCLVRDHNPISFSLWKANNLSEPRDAVLEGEKEWLCQELKNNFTVPADSEESTKCWTLSKITEHLQTLKKKIGEELYQERDYAKLYWRA